MLRGETSGKEHHTALAPTQASTVVMREYTPAITIYTPYCPNCTQQKVTITIYIQILKITLLPLS